MLMLICVQGARIRGRETMLHYDMIRYEIMYLKTLDRHFNTDHCYCAVLMIGLMIFGRLISDTWNGIFLIRKQN